ncbi:6dac4be4-ac7f-48af-8ea4-45c647f8248a [Sclerotinia trifoliorum]|uniref:6dac4be4-ac7f-48af-8ea4-45c647f8248a n=1 Tax=Sclerotinia trifoliorum TaxID=28548 RepID=A0A8H2ZVN6_9HELO|nr:6dac4be4-ac7f-48af-8ea4-45c647f8248a [Sclerotinia trifoliorum]
MTKFTWLITGGFGEELAELYAGVRDALKIYDDVDVLLKSASYIEAGRTEDITSVSYRIHNY